MEKLGIDWVKEKLDGILYSYMFELINEYTYNDLNDRIDKFLLECKHRRVINHYDFKFDKRTQILTVTVDIKNERKNIIVSVRSM